MDITVVIPAYNEAGRIGAALDAVYGHLLRSCASFEILVVDDGSSDGTAAVVEDRGRDEPRIRLVRPLRHAGKGGAVREGVRAAEGEMIFVLDADLSTPPETMDRAVPHLADGADLVAGSRHCPGAKVLVYQGSIRRSLGRSFLTLARHIACPEATDITCGFKGFRRSAARAIFELSRIDGWAFDAETALIARRLHLTRREIPVRWTNDPDSRVRIVKAAVRSFTDLVRIAVLDLAGGYRTNGKGVRSNGAEERP